jgi:hypothetical protein
MYLVGTVLTGLGATVAAVLVGSDKARPRRMTAAFALGLAGVSMLAWLVIMIMGSPEAGLVDQMVVGAAWALVGLTVRRAAWEPEAGRRARLPMPALAGPCMTLQRISGGDVPDGPVPRSGSACARLAWPVRSRFSLLGGTMSEQPQDDDLVAPPDTAADTDADVDSVRQPDAQTDVDPRSFPDDPTNQDPASNLNF